MKEYISLLTRCALLERIAPGELLRMLECLGAQLLHFAKGSSILRQGDPARSFGLLLSGSAQIIRGDVHGSHDVIAAIQPGELFAEALACAALDALPVNVVAQSDCVVLMFSHSRVMQGCPRGCVAHSQLVTALLRLISQKNLQLNQKLEIVMQRTTREKLMAYLELQSRACGSRRFTIPFDRQGLADYLGVERSAMSTELNRLKKEGRIDFHKAVFELLPQETQEEKRPR